MAVNNTIFNSKKRRDIKTNDSFQYNVNGVESFAMPKEAEADFNTYKYWDAFYAPSVPWIKDGSSKDSKGNPATEAYKYKAKKSLFNPFNGVYIKPEFRVAANMPLIDNPSSRAKQRDINQCTIADLVKASADGLMGRQVYTYADFAYCKYLGQMPNNYLITLRRFGAPCGDKIDYIPQDGLLEFEKQGQRHMPDMGRLVTWMGTPGNDLSSILSWSTGYEWKDLTADITETPGEEGGALQSIFNVASGTYRKQVQQGIAGSNYAGKSYMNTMLGSSIGDPPYANAEWLRNYDARKVEGPLNVIYKTKQRDRGLNFNQSFKLIFDYELRSYGGVNGKAAMLDLMSNILCCTYSLGNFWGGERRMYGVSQSNAFANLPIFKAAEQGKLNNPTVVYESFIASIHEGSKAFTNGVEGETTLDKIKNLAKDLGGMLLGGMLNKLGRPQKIAYAALLSPAPTGCWHLTIGNPRNPILEIGNLVCKEATVTHYGPLGLDDFPTGLKVEITLEHGKPRDQAGIEQMYMRGDSRVYAPVGSQVLDMYKGATEIKSSSKALSPLSEQERNQMIARSMKAKSFANDTAASEVISSELLARSASANAANGDTTNVETITPAMEKTLMKFFGTDNEGAVIFSAKEALYGAESNEKNVGLAK